MLTIVTGRAGSGKSGKSIAEFNQYIQDNKHLSSCAYFFVPEQYTMLTERRLLDFQMKEDYLVKGLMGHEVLNFKRFSHRILGLFGGAATDSLNECGKIMMLTAILDKLKESLQYFHSVTEKSHEVARILSLIEEFGKYGITGELLGSVITDDLYLNRKINDLSLIVKEYTKYKKGRYIDENDIFQQMLAHIKRNGFFKKRRVWIDSFTGFTNKELELIEIMLRDCERITITLCTDLSGEPAFSCVDNTYRILTDLAAKCGAVCNTVNLSANPKSNRYKYNNGGIFHLEQNISKIKVADKLTDTSAIEIAECPGPYEEVVRCAEKIRFLHDRENIGYQYIAVALRDVAVYDMIIKAIFRKYQIPFYIDDKKTIDNNPLIKTILSVLSILTDDWQVRDVLECLKSGILTFGGNSDRMENFILQKGLHGRRRWRREREESCALLFQEIDALSANLSNCANIKECCIAFCLYLNKWEFKNTIEEISENLRGTDPELSNEYSRIWNIAMEVIEQIVLFLGDIPVNGTADAAGKMMKLLSAGFSQYKIGFLPSDVNSVQIMNIERSRSGEIKALFLLGANDGVLPAYFTDDGILRDEEREKLKQMNITLADDSEAKASKENYYIYITLSLPSDRLCVSYPLEDISGNEMKPSPVLLRKLKGCFPNLAVSRFIAEERHVQENAANSDAGIASDVNIDLFHIGEAFNTTVSRIETYYKCPFSFLMTYGLSLRPREEAEIQMYDLGNVMHGLIDEASESLFGITGECGIERCTEIVASVYERVAASMRFNGMDLTKRELYALERIKKYAAISFYNVKKQIGAGQFMPCGFEVPFDFENESLLKPITLYTGNENGILRKMNIVGRIDRYDIMEKDGVKYVRIIDYKSSPVTLSEKELAAGVKMQLITYLNAVIDSYPAGTAVPGGALYFKFGDDIVSVKDHVSCAGKIEDNRQYAMNGFVLNNENVIEGMTGGRDTGVIGGKLLTNGGISFANSKILRSEEDFEGMKKQAYDNIIRAGRGIADGKYPIDPSGATDILPCRYCNMKSICGNCANH